MDRPARRMPKVTYIIDGEPQTVEFGHGTLPYSHHGKAEQRQRCRQCRKFLVIEVEQGGNRLWDGQVRGQRGFRRDGEGGGERNHAVARQ